MRVTVRLCECDCVRDFLYVSCAERDGENNLARGSAVSAESGLLRTRLLYVQYRKPVYADAEDRGYTQGSGYPVISRGTGVLSTTPRRA